jgi:uncharacterized protein (DUF2252 family)
MGHRMSEAPTSAPGGRAGAPGRLRFSYASPISQGELTGQGRAARKAFPRRNHADYVPPAGRDPLGILETQNVGRLPDLVPLRMKRMLANPFAFYRGSAALQAADLADAPTTGQHVTICGDAHVANFGIYASPQRSIVFDLNDFDEAAFGPWEWDLKRFVTSAVIAAQHNGYPQKQVEKVALEAAAAYRVGLRQFLELGVLDRYYLRADVSEASGRRNPSSQEIIDRALKAAARRTSARVVRKVTEVSPEGRLEIVEDPPVLSHVTDLTEELVTDVILRYAATVPPDIALLLSKYGLADIARRVVGVGSVGTRCYIAICVGPRDEPLVLQIKEATRSVIDQFGGIPTAVAPQLEARAVPGEHGFRVVAGQRVLQSVTDPFLGYVSAAGYSYYVRQFRDQNVSFDLEGVEPRTFMDYVDACGTALARAHAQSPAAPFIGGYLGSGSSFDTAIVLWALAYAEQSLADFHAFANAVAQRRFPTTNTTEPAGESAPRRPGEATATGAGTGAPARGTKTTADRASSL